MNITFGADPEIFLEKDGEILSAIGLLGGTKNAPRPVGNGIFVQEDNVTAEFNVPASSEIEDIWISCKQATAIIEFMTEAQPIYRSVMEMPEKALMEPQAWVFGCKPDFNVWELGPSKSEPLNDNYRVAGGHIHIGIEGLNKVEIIDAVRFLDLFLAPLDAVSDLDGSLRRKHYGKAGSIRFKPYGFEYRTPSNLWLDDKKLFRAYFTQIQYILNNWSIESIQKMLADYTANMNIQFHLEQVNNRNVQYLTKFLKRVKADLPVSPEYHEIT